MLFSSFFFVFLFCSLIWYDKLWSNLHFHGIILPIKTHGQKIKSHPTCPNYNHQIIFIVFYFCQEIIWLDGSTCVECPVYNCITAMVWCMPCCQAKSWNFQPATIFLIPIFSIIIPPWTWLASVHHLHHQGYYWSYFHVSVYPTDSTPAHN